MIFEVTYKKNGVYHANIIKTGPSAILEEVESWFKKNRPKSEFLGINKVAMIKPGQPVIRILI